MHWMGCHRDWMDGWITRCIEDEWLCFGGGTGGQVKLKHNIISYPSSSTVTTLHPSPAPVRTVTAMTLFCGASRVRLNEEAVCSVHKKCTVEGRRICDINRELAFSLICNFGQKTTRRRLCHGWLAGHRMEDWLPLQWR